MNVQTKKYLYTPFTNDPNSRICKYITGNENKMSLISSTANVFKLLEKKFSKFFSVFIFYFYFLLFYTYEL